MTRLAKYIVDYFWLLVCGILIGLSVAQVLDFKQKFITLAVLAVWGGGTVHRCGTGTLSHRGGAVYLTGTRLPRTTG